MVYKHVGKYLCSKPIPHESCPLCHKTDVLQTDLYLSYVSVGIIPIPCMYAGKQVAVHCSACNYELKSWNGPWITPEEKLTSGLHSSLKEAKRHSLSLWQCIYPWSLMIVLIGAIVGIIGYQVITGMQKQASYASTKELLMHPQAGDIYKANFNEIAPDRAYTAFVLVKVQRIEGNTMYIVRSKNSLELPFTEQDWAALSRDAAAFEDKEYAINLQKFLNEKELGAFYPMPKGNELGRVQRDYSGKLKVVERN